MGVNGLVSELVWSIVFFATWFSVPLLASLFLVTCCTSCDCKHAKPVYIIASFAAGAWLTHVLMILMMGRTTMLDIVTGIALVLVPPSLALLHQMLSRRKDAMMERA